MAKNSLFFNNNMKINILLIIIKYPITLSNMGETSTWLLKMNIYHRIWHYVAFGHFGWLFSWKNLWCNIYIVVQICTTEICNSEFFRIIL